VKHKVGEILPMATIDSFQCVRLLRQSCCILVHFAKGDEGRWYRLVTDQLKSDIQVARNSFFFAFFSCILLEIKRHNKNTKSCFCLCSQALVILVEKYRVSCLKVTEYLLSFILVMDDERLEERDEDISTDDDEENQSMWRVAWNQNEAQIKGDFEYVVTRHKEDFPDIDYDRFDIGDWNITNTPLGTVPSLQSICFQQM
jgi:hypothetical protein